MTRNAMKYLLDFITVSYACISVALFVIVCLLFWNIHVPKEVLFLLATVTIVCWFILLVVCLVDYYTRDWPDEIKRELWKTVFVWGFFTRGLSLGLIVYYLEVVRKELGYESTRKLKRHLSEREPVKGYLRVASSLQSALLFSLLGTVPGVLLGFYLKSDLIFLGTIKVASVVCIATVFIRAPLELIMMDRMVTTEWSDLSFKKYFRSLSALNEYYKDQCAKP